MNSPVKTLKRVPLEIKVSGGIFPKATSPRIPIFSTLLTEGFIAKMKESCQIFRNERVILSRPNHNDTGNLFILNFKRR
jgi:hypothetical protein